jgi:UDP-2,3-diacylglucosamine pyrophosphatase LpxH
VKNYYKTIVLSDIHLGTIGSKARDVVQFLKQSRCETLILNGDIIDGWQLKKYGVWKKKHTRFFKRILKMIEEDQTEVVYLRGNHDDFLDQVMPLRLGKISIQRELIYESFGKRYLVLHGDIFDSITTNLRWIAKLGDVGYTFLLWVNRQYNTYRTRKGLPYYSLSQQVKAKVKSAVSYIDDFEKQLAEIAKSRNCEGVICGHIHQAAIKTIGNIQYMNSGDWVETMSALVEDKNGEWNLCYLGQSNPEMDNEEDENEDLVHLSQMIEMIGKRPMVQKAG